MSVRVDPALRGIVSRTSRYVLKAGLLDVTIPENIPDTSRYTFSGKEK